MNIIIPNDEIARLTDAIEFFHRFAQTADLHWESHNDPYHEDDCPRCDDIETQWNDFERHAEFAYEVLEGAPEHGPELVVFCPVHGQVPAYFDGACKECVPF